MFVFLTLLVHIGVVFSIEEIYVWPYPVAYKETTGGKAIMFDSINFKLFDVKEKKYLDIESDAFVGPMVKRFTSIILDSRVNNRKTYDFMRVSSYEVVFQVDLTDRNLNLETKEDYRLNVTESGTTIVSSTIFGSLRGIETFAQLVTSKTLKSLPISITDYPRYQWRGLMIDVARHYLHIETLETLIDAMESNKLNALHIHLEDSQSFPLFVPEYCLLSEKGAYDPENAIFTIYQLTNLVQYAYLRGVRVIPEIDIPGHTYSWGLGYPGTTAICDSFMDNVNEIPLDPTNDFSHSLAKGIFDYVNNDVFTEEEYVHIGGDEVNYACWEEIRHIAEYMSNHSIDGKDLQGQFMNEIISHVSEQKKNINGKKPIVWQELAQNMPKKSEFQIPKDVLVEVWKSPADIKPVLENGYQQIINSAGWYIDRQFPLFGALHYLMLDVWMDMWILEVEDYVDPKDYHKIIGGESCTWGEQINDLVVVQRIFPKASAVAERLWSPKEVNIDEQDVKVMEERINNKRNGSKRKKIIATTALDIAQKRLNYHVCHNMNLRGIRASPIQPNYCPYML